MIYVQQLSEIDRRAVALVGGKAAALGELMRVAGVRVPPGFCVTTAAFPIADDAAAAIARAVEPGVAYAVRSSAVAEDSPIASFAGQHDSYLNVVGADAILAHVRRCWASLFTERAVAYRRRAGLREDDARMAVVVQRMVDAEAAGVMFTADPITGHRGVIAIEAVHGLGEALVAGRASADRAWVRDGAIVGARGAQPVLTDAQVVQLAAIGRRIAAHFGRPQDIEWCLDRATGDFAIVQSRPITNLFPIPESDGGNHVYVSVGHQQMMTDPMMPLGLSLFQRTAVRPMPDAGGRLFVDVTRQLGAPASRAAVIGALGTSDPLIGDALRTIVARGDFVPELPDAPAPGPVAEVAPLATDPAIVAELIERNRASVAALACAIAPLQGAALLDFIIADLAEMKRVLWEPRSHQAILAGFEAKAWLDDRLATWLGDRAAADVLAQSAPNNVTAEMGLALIDVADAIRPHPEVVAYLRRAAADADADTDLLDGLARLGPGGIAARAALDAYLDHYGMRGVGEIDITRPRWRERPALLVPLLLGDIDHLAPGAGARRFEEGRVAAAATEADVLARLRALPDDGAAKADETRRMIDRVRTFLGYREYPKYGLVCRYFHYKQALLGEADRLVAAGVLRAREDVFFLTFDEIHALVRASAPAVDPALIDARAAAFRAFGALVPPRVLTSDGERVTGAYRGRDDVPAGALVGLAVSAGIAEGRARVVRTVGDLAAAALAPGDILVTAYTDPSWTPAFVAIAGLVTEVGGLMTHGAVIAREYGLPAIVGVEDAMRRIRDGARIRIDGTAGYVELLDQRCDQLI